MKLLLTVNLAVLSILGIDAQVSEKSFQSTGISGSASILEHSVKGYLEPYFSFGTKAKQISVAPTILVTSNLGYQQPLAPRITGARIGYHYWPGTLNKSWDFSVYATLRLQRLQDQWNANLFNESLSDYQEYNLKTIEFTIENYLGYELVLKINKAFRIHQGVGIGWYLSNLDLSNVDYQNALDVVDYRGYDNIGLLLNFSFSISYSLTRVE